VNTGGYELEVIELNQRFGSHQVLKDVTIRVRRGEIYGLLGPNGAGKSTLMKILLGMQRPRSGRILLCGAEQSRETLAQVGGMVELPGLWENLTGAEHMAIHTRLRGTPRERGTEELIRFGLGDARDVKVKKYSLGMRWRLAIGIAMLHRPRLLVLDEPTNGLDPGGIRQMRDLIRALPEEGTTVLISSHNLPEIAQICDRVGVLAEGRIVYEGPVAGVGYQGDLEEGFLRLVEAAKTRE